MISAVLGSNGFVGRREELAFLHEAFTTACEERTRFVPIEGEGGIGKSRLIAEFTASLANRACVASGQCSEHVRSPYLPFAAILERLDTRGTRTVPAPRDRRGNAEEKATFFEATARVLTRASARKPVVAVLEDLQWADSATLELLAYLLQYVHSARIVFLLSLRTEGAASNRALAAFRSRVARQRVASVRLHGLRRNEIRCLIAQAVARDASTIARETLARVEALAEGNPLFAEELVHVVRESGGLNLATHAPLSLQAALSERLAPLSARERAVLVRAAILGQRFDAAFLARIVALPIDDVLVVLQRAVETGLVIESAPNGATFAFRHAMIRQALADQLIVGLAAPLHVRIAEELQLLPDARERTAELAYHWAAAGVCDKARSYNELAAESAWDLYAYRDAIAFYTTALRCDYPPGAARAAVYERLGTLLYIEGCGDEPATWFQKSYEEYAAIGNAQGMAHALLRLADQHWVDARTGESLKAAERAVALLDPQTGERATADALLTLARFSVTLGDPHSAQRYLDAAETVRAGWNDELSTNFHEVRAEAHAALGNTARAIDDCRAACSLAARTGISESIAQVENNVALVACDLGELDTAVEHHETALCEARRTSMPWRVAYCALNYANTAMLRGELHKASRLAWEAIECGVTTATFKTKAAAVGIPLALLLNDRQLLGACADEDAPLFAVRSQEIQRIASVACAFADLRTAHGLHTQARTFLARAARDIARPHRCMSLFAQIADDGDASLVQWARATLARSTARPRVLRACRLLFEARTCRSLESARSARLAAVAAKAFDRIGMRLLAARALECAGHTAQALDRYANMGNVRDAQRLGEALGGMDGVASTQTPLSARQMEVARLVANGETNRAIASRLHISEHTVEHHLSAIFARLEIRSRSALAARIGRAPNP